MHKEDKINYYYREGISLFDQDKIADSISMLEKGRKIAEDENFQSLLYKFNYELSLGYFRKFENTKLSTDLNTSISLAEEALKAGICNPYVQKSSGLMTYIDDSPEAYINVLIHLGVLYQSSGNLEKSLYLLHASKVICKKIYNLQLLGQVYDELGNTYLLMQDALKAYYYYIKSLMAKQVINNKRGIEISTEHLLQLVLNNLELLTSDEVRKISEHIEEETI